MSSHKAIVHNIWRRHKLFVLHRHVCLENYYKARFPTSLDLLTRLYQLITLLPEQSANLEQTTGIS